MKEVEKDSEEYIEIFNLFESVQDNAVRKITSEDNTVEAVVEEGILSAIWLGATSTLPHFFCAEACRPKIEILRTPGIGNISFLNNRNDVLIVTIPNGIFAIDLDLRDTQNFQPIHQESGSSFVVNDENTIYILDSRDIFAVGL